MNINDPEIQKLLRKGRLKAIIKNVTGRRMLIGFERNNRRSRKYRIKHMTSPVDLDALGKDTKQLVEESAATQPANSDVTTPTTES